MNAAPTRELFARWRALQAEHAGLREVRIAIAATYTVEPLVPFLGVFLAERGLFARFEIGPYDQVYQCLLDPVAFRARPADVTIVLPRVEELCAGAFATRATLAPAQIARGRDAALVEIERLVAALEDFQRASGSLVLCGNFAAAASTPLGVLDAGHPASESQLRNELNVALWRSLGHARRVHLVDVADAVASVGTTRAYDARHYVLSRAPYSAELDRRLGSLIARTIAPFYFAPAKVVVVDLDNTLWGGVVGEDGPGALAIGGGGLGAAFVAFQDALLALRQQGVLLCVASKNNEADAWEVFDQIPAMRIKRAHLSAWRIGWGRKSESLRALAEELSLGLESFVFLDDSPTEREEIRRLLPSVVVPDLPDDVALWVRALRAIPALDRMVVTLEDRARATQYAEDASRNAARPDDPAALEAYLRSLELVVTVRRARPDEVPRIAQLTQKTNQFNLTTIRRTVAEIEALVADATCRVFSLNARDRFGDYGLTGAAIITTLPHGWTLDTFLLSCRVLGRGVETAFLRVVLADLAGSGERSLEARFIATPKNAPARSFLPSHGFIERADGTWARASLSPDGLGAAHVAITP